MSTDDGGNTWQMDVFNDYTTGQLLGMCINNTGQGYATGYGGLFLKTQIGVAISEGSMDCGVKIFPNPAENHVFIISDKNIDNIKLYNEVGELLFENASLKKETMLDLKGYRSGIYFVKLDNSVHKILKL